MFTGNSSRVLLTGATGYVGAFILKELLEKTDCKVFCLVRVAKQCEDSHAEAKNRLVSNLQQYGCCCVLPPTGCAATISNSVANVTGIEMDDERVEVVPGDVSMINLGLEADVVGFFHALIDVVIHAAAAGTLTLVQLLVP